MSFAPWLLLLTASATLPLQPAPEKLREWTFALRDQQPEDAFAAVYKVGAKHLVFVAAKHANQADSPTFKMIEDAYARFAFDTVIGEGFATSRGPNPPSLLRYAADSKPRADGFVEGGETVPTVLGAEEEKAALWGGEADDLAIKQALVASGFSAADVLGFYVLRNIPQWIGERKIVDAGDERLQPLVTAVLERNRQTLQIPQTVLPGFGDWSAWYRALNGKRLGADFVTEEVGPLADGKFGTNRIAHAISRARDTHLHRLIVEHLNAEESVLVVFGASHLMILRPSLDHVLGSPCYVGADLAQGAAACR
jgi:hypothetical protein